MAYVYRHIRLDKNVPFYIGIGSDDKYKRANERRDRNVYWKRIEAKSNIEIEILFDGISWKDACKKEIEFIALYKRTKDGGTLCNITKGGEGQLGLTPRNSFVKGQVAHNKGKPMSNQQIEILRQANIGRPAWNKGVSNSPETIKKWRESMGKTGFRNGEKHHNFKKPMPDHVKKALAEANKNRAPWNKGIRLSEEVKSIFKKSKEKLRKPILQYDLNGNLLAEYESLTEAAKATGHGKSSIGKVALGYEKRNKGFVWKYKTGDCLKKEVTSNSLTQPAAVTT